MARQKKQSAEAAVRDIRHRTRRKFSPEEKIRIVLEGLRGEQSISDLCRRNGIASNLYYRCSKDFLEAGKKQLVGDKHKPGSVAAATTEVLIVARRSSGATSRGRSTERVASGSDELPYLLDEGVGINWLVHEHFGLDVSGLPQLLQGLSQRFAKTVVRSLEGVVLLFI
jgi:transposase